MTTAQELQLGPSPVWCATARGFSMLHELEVPKKPDLTSIGHIFVMCRFSVMCRFRLSRAQQQSGNECTSLWTSASKHAVDWIELEEDGPPRGWI